MPRKYTYKRKKESEIEDIASSILNRFKHRWDGKQVNIEGLVEDYGITVIARSGLRYPMVGYSPKAQNYIVVGEKAYEYLPNLRHTLSEEFAHKVLEFELYKKGPLPPGSECYKLSKKKHKDIEDNADMLAAALLLPLENFKGAWQRHQVRLSDGYTHPTEFLRQIVQAVSLEFNVIHFTVSRRARDLRLIGHGEYQRLSLPLF